MLNILERFPTLNTERFGLVCNKAVSMINILAVELIKVLVAKFFLEIITKNIFPPKKNFPMIRYMVVISPLAEEIYFRGLLQHGIKLTQLGWNRFFKRELTEVDVKIQRVWRIQLTALTFAASYFDRRKGLLPFVIASIDGVSYSLMSEKYKTLSLGILSNGINSILALSLSTYPHYTEAIIFTMLSNKIGSLSVGILANNRLDQAITYTYHRLDQTLAYTKQSIHNLYDRVKLLL